MHTNYSMDYYFGDFHFNADQFILVNDNKTINLRVNEGKLLALLLSQPQRIFSKNIILDTVWADKVVAEQSIFQNISNLRAILGNDAIATHPKKGYQWKLALKSPPSPTKGFVEQVVSNKDKRKVFFACFITLVGLLFFFLNSSQTQPSFPIISVMPMTFNSTMTVDESEVLTKAFLVDILSNNNAFSVTQSKKEDNNNVDLTLKTSLKKLKTNFIMSFEVLAENQTWKGIIVGDKEDELSKKLKVHIEKLVLSNFLTSKQDNPKYKHSQLQLLQSQYPDDINILYQFTRNTLNNNFLNEAQLLISDLKKLALQQQNKPYLATAYRLTAEVLIQQKNNVKAKEYLQDAEALYVEIGDEIGVANVNKQYGQIAQDQDDYAEMKRFMQKSFNILEQEKEHLQQFNDLVLVSVYANKANQISDRDFFLAEAKRIQETHSLPKLLLARVYFQQALFAEKADNQSSAEQHYRDVLALYNPEQNSWHKERAQFHLAELLMSSDQITKAIDIFLNEGELTDKESVILSTIYYKGQEYARSISLAKKAYRNAVLTSDILTALDAALLLIKLSNFDDDLQRKAYIDFINENATSFFVYFNKASLTQLGLYKLLAAGK